MRPDNRSLGGLGKRCSFDSLVNLERMATLHRVGERTAGPKGLEKKMMGKAQGADGEEFSERSSGGEVRAGKIFAISGAYPG